MDIKKFAERIGDLLGKDELEVAIKELSNLMKRSGKLNEALIQSARLNDVMTQIRMGTISLEDANITKNQIRFAILSLLNEIEVAAQDEEVVKELDKIEVTNSSILIQQHHTGSGDNIAGDKIITK